MPNSSIGVTPGTGSNIAVNPVAGLNMQVFKLDAGADGASYPIVGDGTHGLPVQVTQVLGNVTVAPQAGQTFPISAASALPISAASAIPVSAPANSPVAVQLSNGSSFLATLPISGTVTGNQGAPAGTSAPWPIAITDGANGVAGIATVAGQKLLNVNVLQTVAVGAQPDKSGFLEGTTAIDVVGGEFNDSATQPATGQVAAVRITQLRAMHINLRQNNGTELGIAATPLRVDPTGTTTQPVNVGQVAGATVSAANPMPAQLSQGGAVLAASNPLPVIPGPTPSGFWKGAISFTASQTAQALHTPASGKTAFIEGFIVTVITSGELQIYDGTNSATNMVYQGTPPVGATFHVNPTRPIPLSAINNVLRYTTGSGATGDITCWGYDQ